MKEVWLMTETCDSEKNMVYFLPPRIIQHSWVKKPSIVFDQEGTSNFRGHERLLFERADSEEDLIFDSLNFSKPSTVHYDWETLNEDDWDIHPNLNATSLTKDFHFPMFAPDRLRKPSISDIIDVLNLKEEKESFFDTKIEGFDSGYSDSLSSNGTASVDNSSDALSSSSEEYSPFDFTVANDTEDTHFERINASVNCHDYVSQITGFNTAKSSEKCLLSADQSEENTFSKSNGKNSTDSDHSTNECLSLIPQEPIDRTKLSIENASSLLSSKDDAIIIVLDENHTIKYMSTSRQNLEDFLSSKFHKINASDNLFDSSPGSDAVTHDINKTPQKKRRGRKRIHEPDKPEAERDDKKRERNNEACRKFRRSRKMSQKDLFEQESVLLQRNLNLKEQIAALNRQLSYLRDKMGLQVAS